MNADRIARRGLIAALILAGPAAICFRANLTEDECSKHEHDRQLKSSPMFQVDFPPGEARGERREGHDGPR